jgi:hypothetical protein
VTAISLWNNKVNADLRCFSGEMRLEPCLMLANSDGTVSYFDEYNNRQG